MKMKRRIYILGLAAAIMTLVQCSVEEQESLLPAHETEIPFEVIASGVDTKTVNEGKSTAWELGDSFTLFHKARRTTKYVSDGAFTVDDVSTGHAKGTLAAELTESIYDWYAIYPAGADDADPTDVGNVLIGSKADENQIQDSYGSTSHIDGISYPVVGKASGVQSTEIPSLSFAHASALAAIRVTNSLDEGIAISSVTLEAPESIVGLFDMNITTSPVTLSDVEGAVSSKATVSVTEGASLAKGEEAVLYMGLKPFTAASGSSISLTVNVTNASEKTWSETKTVTLSAETSFEAGKIKTLNFDFDKESPEDSHTTLYVFKRTDTMVGGKQYVMISTSNDVYYIAKPVSTGVDSEILLSEEVTDYDGEVRLTSMDNAFTFALSSGGYTIQQSDGRYLYHSGTGASTTVTTALPSEEGIWSVSISSSTGRATISYPDTYKYGLNTYSSGFKFSLAKSQSSSKMPYLYEYVGTTEGSTEPDDIEEFLATYVYGVYSYQGSTWQYADGTGELDWKFSGDNVRFRILEPANHSYTEVSGVPANVAVGDVVTVGLVRYENETVLKTDSLDATVLKVEDGDVWMRTENRVGFIINVK
mgnify:CR=1 FL=1